MEVNENPPTHYLRTKKCQINMDKEKDKYSAVPPWVKRAEFKLDRFNHLMELLRTCLAACTLVLQVVILLKLFNVI